MVQNLLFISAGDTTYLFHSLSLCKIFICSSCLPCARLFYSKYLWPRIFYLTPLVLLYTYPTTTLCVKPLLDPPMAPCARRSFHIHLWLRTCYLTPLVLVHIYPNPTNCVMPLFGPLLMSFSRRFSYPSLAKNMLFKSSPVSTALANSHRWCNNTVCHFSVSTCQAVHSSPSLAKNNVLFNSTCVSTSFSHSHNLYNSASWPLSAATCQEVCQRSVSDLPCDCYQMIFS